MIWGSKEFREWWVHENGTLMNRINGLIKGTPENSLLFFLPCEDKGEVVASLEIRMFILYYLKGIKGSKEIKNKICQTKSSEEIFKIIDEFKEKLDKGM